MAEISPQPDTQRPQDEDPGSGPLRRPRGLWVDAAAATAAATLLVSGFPVGGQDLPLPSPAANNPAGSQVEQLVTPSELPALDPSGTTAGNNDGMLVAPMHLDQMLADLDLPPSSSETGGEADANGNPLFSSSGMSVDAATVERSRAMSALLKGNTKVGPFGLTGPFLGFQSGLAITGMYDSNILQISEELSQETYGQGPESFVIRFAPFARYRSPGPLWFLDANYSPSYVIYTDFDALNGWEHKADLSLQYERQEWLTLIHGYYRTTISPNSLDDMVRREGYDSIGGTADSSFDRENLSGEDYGIRIRAAYNGRKLQASLGGGYNLSDGQNRYYSSDIREELYQGDLLLSYKLSPKTRIQLDGGYSYRGPYSPDIEVEPQEPPPPPPPIYVNSLGQQVPPPAGAVVATPEPVVEEEEEKKTVVPTYDETTAARINFAALWQVTPLLELGPGVRATYDSRSDGLSSTSIGPMLRARYQVSRRISLNAQVAAEFHQFEERKVEPAPPPPPPPQPQIILVPDDPVVTDPNQPATPAPVVKPAPVAPAPEPEPEPEPDPTFEGSDSPFISAELGAVWSPTDDWSLRLVLARNARVSSSSEEDFREVFSTRASVIRRFPHGTLTLTGGYEIESLLREQTAGKPSLDREYLTVDLSYSFPVWKDRAFATAFVRYRDDQTGTAQNSWDGYQAGVALGMTF